MAKSDPACNIRPCKGESIIAALDDYVVIDVETTGLSPLDCEIIEFAAVRVIGGNVVDHFQRLSNPGRNVPASIERLTGITNDMLASAPPVDAVIPEFLDFIGDSVLICHNVSFDVNFIYDCAVRHLGRGISNDHVDTLRLSRRAVPTIKYHKLCDMQSHYYLHNLGAHRALDDALCTYQLYERLKPCIKFDDVLAESCAFGGYDADTIYAAILDMLGGDPSNIELRRSKTSTSIYMHQSLAFSIRINSRTQCLDCPVSVAREYVGVVPEITRKNDQTRISIASSPDSVDQIHALVIDVYDKLRSDVTGDIFGCCSDFIACSDRGECVKKHLPDYNGCLYRKNLDSGRIFYGKNKNC